MNMRISILCFNSNQLTSPFTTNNQKVKGSKTKKFRVRDDGTVIIIKSAYIKNYGKKGCKSVIFYYNNVPLMDMNKTFAALGVKDMDVLVAMENGRKYEED